MKVRPNMLSHSLPTRSIVAEVYFSPLSAGLVTLLQVSTQC